MIDTNDSDSSQTDLNSIIVSASDISEFLGCTTRYVYKIINDNKTLFNSTRVERNQINLKGFVIAYITLLKNKNKQKTSISETDSQNNINPSYQRARYNASMADKIELENAIKRGELVDIDFVISQLLNIQNIYNSGLNGLRGAMMTIIQEKDDRKRAKQKISAEINRTRETTANEIEVLAATLISDLSRETTTEFDSLGMGGEVPDTTS